MAGSSDILRRSSRLWAAALAGLAMLAVQPALAQPIGSVLELTPDAYGTPPTEEPAPLTLGGGVVVDEIIQTFEIGNTHIRFLDDTDLRVGAASVVILDNFLFDPSQGVTEMVLSIAVGTARIVSGDIPPQGLRIETPVAIVGVRGTDFVVTVEASGRTTIAVIEGSVIVTPVGRPPVTVNAGQTIVIEPDADIQPVVSDGLTVPDDPGLDLPPAATITPVDDSPDPMQKFEDWEEALGDIGDWQEAAEDPAQWGQDYVKDNYQDWVLGPELSADFHLVFQEVFDAFDSLKGNINRRPVCERAAYTPAWESTWELSKEGPVDALFRSFFSIMETIGGGPKAVWQWVTGYFDGSNTKEEVKARIEAALQEEPPSVYEDSWSQGPCDVAVRAIIDKASKTYEVFLSGNCHCEAVPTWEALGRGRDVLVKSWRLAARGSFSIDLDEAEVAGLQFKPYRPRISFQADCSCAGPGTYLPPPEDEETDPEEPTEPDEPPTEPEEVTPPSEPEEPEISEPDWTYASPCPACQPLADAIDAEVGRLGALRAQRAGLSDAVHENLRDQSRIDRKIRSLQTRLDAAAGSGAESFDPETSLTTSSYDQGDGTVVTTVTDANGNILEQRTRESRSSADIAADLEGARAEADRLRQAEAELRQAISDLESDIAESRANIEALRAAFWECVDRLCRGEGSCQAMLAQIETLRQSGNGALADDMFEAAIAAGCLPGDDETGSTGEFEVDVLQVIPQTGTNPFDPDLDTDEEETATTVSVIANIPISRLSLVGPDSCPADHYHGDANDCSGVFTVDPAPGVCGHGKAEDVVVIAISDCPDL